MSFNINEGKLSVSVIDSYHGPVALNFEDQVYPILIDDSLQTIKEKLFLFGVPVDESEESFLYHPNLLKIVVNDTILKKSIASELSETSETSELSETSEMIPVIYVTHLIDYLKKTDGTEFDLELLQKSFVDLTQNDLDYALFVIKNETNEFVEEYLDAQGRLIDRLIERYQTDTNSKLARFYDLCSQNVDLDLNIEYPNIEFKIRKSPEQLQIRIEKLFNTLELSERIPFIALSKRYSSERGRGPIVKTYNDLLNLVSEREVRGWLLNEKTKTNQSSFKIVKGLMLKIKVDLSKTVFTFLTLNILPDGYLMASLQMKTPLEFDEIKKLVRQTIESVLKTLNELDTRKIIMGADLELESLDAVITTDFEIDRTKFTELLLNPEVSEKILEKKNTKATDFVSMYYKKISRQDIIGLTVNIRDNPFDLKSSIITIYGAESVFQCYIIYMTLYYLNAMAQNRKKVVRKVKEITKKALLKREGFFFNPRQCQKQSQPEIVTDPNAKTDQHTIRFDKWTFRCSNEDYPYPGFHPDNVPCCYKTIQVGKEAYIRNMDPESLDVLVKPSNLKVKIAPRIEAFVIKKISDNIDNQSELNYYYLSEKNELLPITDPNTIKFIQKTESDGNIWLETVSLSEVIYPPSTHKCQKKPELNPELLDQGISTYVNRKNINAPCDIYDNAKHFGFASSSIPCCYSTPREIFITKNKRKESDIKKYIATTSNKMLTYKKLGVLTDELDRLFNQILGGKEIVESDETEIKIKPDTFYRMGIVQNKQSFLNAVLLGIDNNLNGLEIYGASDFKTIIKNYIENEPELFKRLNNGMIISKFHSIDNYTRSIRDNAIRWEDTIDILEIITSLNILILDISEGKTRIVCRYSHKFNPEYPSLILLKKGNFYELVVKTVLDEESKLTIQRTFESNISTIEFLIKYQNTSCIKEDVYPENYPYRSLWTFDTLKTLIQPVAQIVNSFNLTSIIETERGLVPIFETGILENLPIKSEPTLFSLKDYIAFYGDLNIGILGILDSDNKTIGAIMTEFGFLIPYRKSERDPKLPKLNFKYYYDYDHRYSEAGPVLVDRSMSNEIMRVKYKIAQALQKISNSKEVREFLMELIKETDIPRIEKIKQIVDTIKQLNKKRSSEFVLSIIANEMLSDTTFSLINGNVQVENRGDIIKRDTESVLLNINDIYRWIDLYKS